MSSPATKWCWPPVVPISGETAVELCECVFVHVRAVNEVLLVCVPEASFKIISDHTSCVRPPGLGLCL